MPGPRKHRKNGKEGGSVIAAIEKHGAKFDSNAPTPKDSVASSPVVSPEIKPSSLSSNENPIATPLLDAVSSASVASNSPSTREWARGLTAGMAGSPSNLISLTGESPPTAPSSYEDSRGIAIRSGWSSPRPTGPYHPPSASPPVPGRRPISFHMGEHYSPPDAHLPLAAAAAARRSSMHYGQTRAASNPPLPHHPQPHFYGAAALDIDLQRQTGLKAGERGYHVGFDTLPPQDGFSLVPGKDTVVLAGYEGGLEVYSAGRRGLERVAGLKGLRGGVYHAKVLPWTVENSDLFPLVAVVIHGPNIPPPTPEVHVEGDYDAVSAERSEGINASPEPSVRGGANRATGVIESYQTTVEVFSLKTGRHVSVLLEAPKIPVKSPVASPGFQAPPPTGAFHIHADGGTIVVSSGITGECWVYRQAPPTAENPLHFRCHGKLWTTLQQPPRGEAAADPERSRSPGPQRPRPQVAIVSLASRWIAYCPAAPSSQISLRAVVPVPAFGRAPGLSSLTPPQLPPVNLELDLPVSESVMNKIMRDATQELIQGAKWVGKQGLQAWNNYWNPQPQTTTQQPRSPGLPPQGWGNPDGGQFPPTHGAVVQPVAKDPGLVSVLDVETLGSSANPHPVGTFAPPNGCSFLSFSPSGLSLFTASTKGDVQTVWDLMRIQYTKSSPLQATSAPSNGPKVRQIAQFSRMTVARIVDVAWTRPHGERLAMVTERGTVHLLDLPSSAFTWPPPRRRRAQEAKSAAAPDTPTSAVSLASTALSSVREVARPLITRQRRSNSNTSPPSGGGLGEYAAQGGKVLAASISQSLGKTGNAISQLRNNGENRVSLPSSGMLPERSCVIWVSGRRGHALFVLGGGLVRTFPVKNRRTSSGTDKRAPRLSRYTDFQLPLLPDDVISPLVKHMLEMDKYLDFTDLDAANNTMVLNQPKPRPWMGHDVAESSIPQAEIESCAPYQPFHTDRRVALYEFTQPQFQPPLPQQPQQEPDIAALMAGVSLDENLQPASESPTPRRKKGSSKKRATTPSPDTPEPVIPTPVGDDTTGTTTIPLAQASLPPSYFSLSESTDPWAFGQPIPTTRLDLGGAMHLGEDDDDINLPLDASRALPASAMERILLRTDDGGEEAQIVVTTRRRRGAVVDNGEDGFFEDDCEVLDFADQRV
ncbi:hypothetical protein VTJ04DRAFT_445 [Mycothermus thermophilus]|uniref:uncharacterized protein n=1 Tax=Humicola insolens TaxID=85995 RepID=UPI0037429B02